MASHPVVLALGLVRVHEFAVAEDVHEELAAGPQPAGDAAEQRLVVAHVLEHLDRHHAVEAPFQRQLVDVAGQHLDVAQPALAALPLDELALRRRIGHRDDARARVALRHPQGERAPAAAEFEDVLAVVQSCALAVEPQHQFLRLVQAFVAARVQAAGILEPAAQAQLEEARRQFVVLRVGGVGVDRDRTGAQPGQQVAVALPRARGVGGLLLAQSRAAQAADADAGDRIRHPAALAQFDRVHGGPAWET